MVERLVTSGRYQNASEVLRDGLRLIENREAEERARLKALRDAVNVGIADIEAGRFESFDSPTDIKRYMRSIGTEVVARKATVARAK
jgi:antitoxin ParD1/3/4